MAATQLVEAAKEAGFSERQISFLFETFSIVRHGHEAGDITIVDDEGEKTLEDFIDFVVEALPEDEEGESGAEDGDDEG